MIKGLPSRLKKLRKQYQYSQKAVADKIGVSPAIVSAYERGDRTPSTDTILSLSRLFHCSTDYLLGNINNDVDTVINVNDLSSEQIKVLHSLYK